MPPGDHTLNNIYFYNLTLTRSHHASLTTFFGVRTGRGNETGQGKSRLVYLQKSHPELFYLKDLMKEKKKFMNILKLGEGGGGFESNSRPSHLLTYPPSEH